MTEKLKSKAEITIAQLEAEGKIERYNPSIFDKDELDNILFELRCTQAKNIKSILKNNTVYGPNGHLKP